MTNIHFVTYATHETGMFRKLIDNKYGVEIKVLGMGTKWNGFMDKIRGVNEYSTEVAEKSEKDIIVFIDGFDTIIGKNVNSLIEKFQKYNCDILVSEEPRIKYISQKLFGNYPTIANSGMYMGYAKNIKRMTDLILERETKDDQEALNFCINTFNDELNARIDTEKEIFYNNPFISIFCSKNEPKCYFKSYPGGNNNTLSYRLFRLRRAVWDYYPYFKVELFSLLIIILLIVAITKKCRVVK